MTGHAGDVVEPVARRNRDCQLDDERDEREERRRDREQDRDDARLLQRKQPRLFGPELLRLQDQGQDRQPAGDGGCAESRGFSVCSGWTGVSLIPGQVVEEDLPATCSQYVEVAPDPMISTRFDGGAFVPSRVASSSIVGCDSEPKSARHPLYPALGTMVGSCRSAPSKARRTNCWIPLELSST